VGAGRRKIVTAIEHGLVVSCQAHDYHPSLLVIGIYKILLSGGLFLASDDGLCSLPARICIMVALGL
jgi:hypothetical protein